MDPINRLKAKIVLVSAAAVLYAGSASADPLIDAVGGINNLIYGIAAGVAALLIVLHAVKYKTAPGPVEREEAKRGIINVILGLIILMVAGYMVGLVYYVEPVATPSTIPKPTATTRIYVTTPSVPTTASVTTTATATSTSTSTTTTRPDVLIAALKANMKKSYSDAQIATLESKIKEYQAALAKDGLGSVFLYLDEQNTSDLIASKVTNPTDWNNVDGILDQVVQKLGIKYVLIVGGYSRFPVGKQGSGYLGYDTDNPYSDSNKDDLPDVALGRVPDPNGGDIGLLTNAFSTFTALHNSGGLDLSKRVGRALCCNYKAQNCWTQYVWGNWCPKLSFCKETTADASSAASGSDFFYMTQHGDPGPPQQYVDALFPSDVSGMDVSNAVWMMVPCYGGVIDYSSTSQSIVLTFFKKGGAIHMGSTNMNCCAVTGTTCNDKIDDGQDILSGKTVSGVGGLYYRIARNFNVGTRIGDAYKKGKTDYKADIGNGAMNEFYINCLYGDPTLKIKSKW